jgi:hypothetical protein
MSDAIKGGMYRGDNPGMKAISLDERFVKIKTEDGSIIEVPSRKYVTDLERQILDLRKSIGIVEGMTNRQDGLLKRLGAGIRKVDQKLR